MNLTTALVVVSVLGACSGPARVAAPAQQATTATSCRSPVAPSTIAGASAGTSAIEVFDRERRDPGFAEPRERLFVEVAAGVKREISPDVDLDFECHTTTCHVVACVRAKESVDDVLAMLQTIPWGDRVSVSMSRDHGVPVLTFYSLFDGPMAVLATQTDYMRLKRLVP